MSNKKEFSDIFDDDFEVTYEDDSGMSVDIGGTPKQAGRSRSQWKTADDYATDFVHADDDYNDGYEIDGTHDNYKGASIIVAHE